jgi:hypothetical protein
MLVAVQLLFVHLGTSLKNNCIMFEVGGQKDRILGRCAGSQVSRCEWGTLKVECRLLSRCWKLNVFSHIQKIILPFNVFTQ